MCFMDFVNKKLDINLLVCCFQVSFCPWSSIQILVWLSCETDFHTWPCQLVCFWGCRPEIPCFALIECSGRAGLYYARPNCHGSRRSWADSHTLWADNVCYR